MLVEHCTFLSESLKLKVKGEIGLGPIIKVQKIVPKVYINMKENQASLN